MYYQTQEKLISAIEFAALSFRRRVLKWPRVKANRLKLTYLYELEVRMGRVDEVVTFFFNNCAGDFQNH